MRGWVKVGEITVDGGLCWIGDPGYLSGDRNIFTDWHKFCDSIKDLRDTKQFEHFEGNPGLGVVTRTGTGDGVYSVYAQFKEGIVSKIMVDFWGDEDEE